MSIFRHGSRGSNNGTPSSSEKKSSLPVRFIKWTAFQMISFIFAILLLGVGYATWTTLSPSQGASGQPVNQTLVQGIINNINDLNSRLGLIESKGQGYAKVCLFQYAGPSFAAPTNSHMHTISVPDSWINADCRSYLAATQGGSPEGMYRIGCIGNHSVSWGTVSTINPSSATAGIPSTNCGW